MCASIQCFAQECRIFDESVFAGECTHFHAFLGISVHVCAFAAFMLQMVSAGMPELDSEARVLFVREKLRPDLNDTEAGQYIKLEIQRSLETAWRRFDDFLHDNKQYGCR